MKLQHLEAFVMVARVGSIKEAAVELGCSQPSVTKQIRELEKTLGQELLDRSGRGVRLTPVGVLFIARAREILSLSRRTVEEFSMLHGDIGGHVVIGVVESSAVMDIAKAIKNVRDKHPGVSVALRRIHRETVLERLASGSLSFALVPDAWDVVGYERLTLSTRDRWGILVPDTSVLSTKESVTLNDLEGLPLICPDDTVGDRQLARWLDAHGDQCQVIYDVVYNAPQLVGCGVGYAVINDCSAGRCSHRGLTFVPLVPSTSAGMSMVWDPGRARTRVELAFLESVRAICAQQPEQFDNFYVI